MNESSNEDPESIVIDQLMSACGAWLQLQEAVQAAAFTDVRRVCQSAAALRFEVEIQARTKFANARIVAIDGEGSQIAVLRSLNAQPRNSTPR